MPQFPDIKWGNGISKKLGKAPRKTLYKRKVLYPGSVISGPDALWKNIALQLQERLCFPIWPGIVPHNLDHSHYNIVVCWPHSMWIDSSPLNTPNPAFLSPDNMLRQHTYPPPSLPHAARAFLYWCPWLLSGELRGSSRLCWGESIMEGRETEASGKLGEFEKDSDIVPVAAYIGPPS